MLRGTPRTFVGSVAFVLAEPVSSEVADAARAEVGRLSGISRCDLDGAAGTVVVTARSPVDRADVVAALDRCGCRVRA